MVDHHVRVEIDTRGASITYQTFKVDTKLGCLTGDAHRIKGDSRTSACQAAVNGSTSSIVPGINDTMVCNTAPRVYAAGELSCQVNVRLLPLLGETI